MKPLTRFFTRTLFHLRRAFSWDLRAIPIEEDEQTRLAKEGAVQAPLQRYLCWRRSVLIVLCAPVCLLALLDTLDNLADEDIELNGLGWAWLTLLILAAYAMPVSAVLALRSWSRVKTSWRLLVWGWSIAFLVPLGLLALPFTWIAHIHVPDGLGEQAVQRIGSVYVGLAFFAILLVFLPVMIISIGFGMQRASFRLKTLLPESPVPGLLLAASAPLLPLFALPLFVLLVQIANSPLLVGGAALLLLSPVFVVVRAGKLMRPFREGRDFRFLYILQLVTRITFWAGVLCWIAYAFVKTIPIPNLEGEGGKDFYEKTILGFTSASSLFRPWNWSVIRWLIVEMLGRSLFTMVVVGDLLVRVNAYLWIAQRTLARTGEAEAYDRLMSHLDGT